MFLTYALRKTFFRLSLKTPKWLRFQNLRIKQIQPVTDQYHFCFVKAYEKHVHIYLNDYLEKRQLLHPFQSGFRRKYSCNTALARLTNSWLTAMNKSEVSGVVFLDLKKAFDLVDHDILKKLAIYLKNSSSLPFFKSYLHNRMQCVLLLQRISKVWCTTGFCFGTYCF